MRYGVIGTGMMGIEHILSIAHIDGAAVTAYADPHGPSRQAAATVAPDAVAFESHRDLISSNLCNVVVVATPNHTHRELLLDLLPTPLHILVEKPLCTTVQDCRTVVDAARGRKAVTWVGLEYRYMPPIARLVAEVQAGTVGVPRMMAIREHRFPFLPKVGDWNRFNRLTGGTLVEKCCHFFDLMTLALDSQPTRVMASGGQDVNHLDEFYEGARPDLLDNAFVIVDFESGARASLDLCMFAEATRNQEEVSVVGDRGKVEALIPENVIRIGRRGTHWIGGIESEAVDDPRVRFTGQHEGACYLQHLAFADACRTGKAAEVGLRAGMLAVAMGVAAQLSIVEARPVEIDELH